LAFGDDVIGLEILDAVKLAFSARIEITLLGFTAFQRLGLKNPITVGVATR